MPFVLADGGGSPGSFGQSLIVAVLLAILNNSFEQRLPTLKSRRIRLFASCIFGLLVVAVYSAMLVLWKTQGILRNPIATYGVVPTIIAIGGFIVLARLTCLAVDESSKKGANTREQSA